jgi:ATP-binding cassette subfamily F protein 3
LSNLLQFQGVKKAFGARVLLNGVSFSLQEGEHIGVIGPNGAGKTTLFKILNGDLDVDAGEIVRRRGLRVGYLAQHDEWPAELTVEDYLISAQGLPLWDLKILTQGLGLDEALLKKTIVSLSGGYRMRCKLLFLMAQEPDLLLLDEPTNYLDLESLVALENFLQGYKKAFMLISHDREFLRRTTDHIVEVEGGEVTKYPGNLDDYLEQKELLRQQLEARARNIEEKRKAILDLVQRFGAKATKARQAQSRLKSLSKLEKIDVKPLSRGAKVLIPEPRMSSKVVFDLDDVDLGYGSRVVLKSLGLQVQRGDHLAVVGYNGAGKSTLLKGLADRLQPLRGQIKRDERTTIGYFAQHVPEALNPQATILEELQKGAYFETTDQEIMNLAGSLLFSKEDLSKKISVLSGGEKSRVALGQILLRKCSCLLLDEPTNHLDFETVEALTHALKDFAGTLIVVSHNRSFVAQVATKILEIQNGVTRFYPGTYDEYVWSVAHGSLASRHEADTLSEVSVTCVSTVEVKSPKVNRKLLSKDLKKLDRDISSLEVELEGLENRILEINEALQSPLESPEQQRLLQELAELHHDKESKEQTLLEHYNSRDELSQLMEEA